MEHPARLVQTHSPPEDGLMDPVGDGEPKARGPLAAMAYALGGIGLLGATASDALAVAGRHAGLPLLGSIELVQVMVVLLGTSAMLIATLTGGHASVHIVTERLRLPAKERLARIAALVSAGVFLMLAAGSIMVAYDLWNGHEETEMLQLPMRWLRLLWIVFAIMIAGIFLRQALRSRV